MEKCVCVCMHVRVSVCVCVHACTLESTHSLLVLLKYMTLLLPSVFSSFSSEASGPDKG